MRNIMMGPAQHLDGAGGRYVEQIRKMMTKMMQFGLYMVCSSLFLMAVAEATVAEATVDS